MKEAPAVRFEPEARSDPSWQILDALSYLNQCRKACRSFAVLTSAGTDLLSAVMNRFTASLPVETRVARVFAPTDSSHAFLEAILVQLGFEPFESTADDLQRLLTVVLRQGAGRESGAVVIMEDAQAFGPRVFEVVREIARNSHGLASPPLIVLTGHSGLNRVLDSRGMASVAQLTRLRFDLDQAPTQQPAALPPESYDQGNTAASEPSPAQAELILSLNQNIAGRYPVDCDRLLIGRSAYNDVCIASRFVSRQHALLIRNTDGDWLVDLHSTNGTYVNSESVHHRRLVHGDVISIGNHRLHYENPAGLDAPSRAAGDRDQLSETMVMRSLQAVRRLRQGPPPPSQSEPTPSAA